MEIRILTAANNKDEVGAHFEQLSDEDRNLRFHGTTTTARAKEFGEKKIFENGIVFGLYITPNDKSILVGVGHLILDKNIAQISVSVAAEHRRNHYGKSLIEKRTRFSEG